MDRSNYMTRAMQARDPRFARILGKLGYESKDGVGVPQQVAEPAPNEREYLRAEYEKVIGKKPFNGWDADTLRAKIADHRDA